MSTEPPLVRDVYPDLVDELADLLVAEGEHDLAVAVRDIRLVEPCGCGDDFCQSFRTAPRPRWQPYGPGYRCVPLDPDSGMLVLDVVDERIMYVEVVNRDPLRDVRRQGFPA